MTDNTQKKINSRTLRGLVVSDKMQNTAVVAVTRLRMHPKIKKHYKITKRFKAHNQNNQYKTGQKVVIQEIRPMSKEKRWIIMGLVQKSKTQSKDL